MWIKNPDPGDPKRPDPDPQHCLEQSRSCITFLEAIFMYLVLNKWRFGPFLLCCRSCQSVDVVYLASVPKYSLLEVGNYDG